MILTFEIKDTDLEIHFDDEGRDMLMTLLSECRMPGDHKHLLRMPGPASYITMENFDEGYTPAESVTLWLLGREDERNTEESDTK